MSRADLWCNPKMKARTRRTLVTVMLACALLVGLAVMMGVGR